MTNTSLPSADLAQYLPLLRSEYLTAHPANLDFWQKWGTLSGWSAVLCPVYHWENTLFLGCQSADLIQSFTPPENFTGHVVFILCEPEALSEFYARAQSLLTPKQPAFLAPKLTVPTASSAPTDDPFAGMLESETPAPEANASEGLELKDSEEGSAESSTEEKLQLDEPIGGLELDLSAPSITLTPASPLQKTASIPPQEPTLPAAQAIETAEIPQASEVLKPSVPPPLPVAPVAVTPQVAATTTVIPKVTNKPVPAKLDAFTQNIFQEMKAQFIKSMLFKKEGNAFVAWKWDSEFHPTAESTTTPISLGTPSPFRIVTRTMKPYHGFIVQNEISDKFFEDWNESQIPDHLTVYPIVVNDQVVGALLGIAEKAVNQKASLALAHKLAFEVEASFKNGTQAKAS